VTRPAARRPRPVPVEPEQTAVPPRPVTGADIAGSVLFGLVGVLAAIVAVMLIPLYAGSVIVPITVLLGIATNIVLPLLVRRLIDSLIVISLPIVLWAATILVLSSPRPEGDVLLPGAGGPMYVGWGLLIGGVLAGTFTVVASAGRRWAPPPGPTRD